MRSQSAKGPRMFIPFCRLTPQIEMSYIVKYNACHPYSLLINPADGNLHKLLLKYTELDSQYEGLSDNLKRMNGTISYLMNSVTYMQNHFDDRITWISQLLDGAGKYLLLLFFSVKKSGGDLVSMIFICMISKKFT